MRTRWIIIGRVKTGFFVRRRNAGYPHGMFVCWSGCNGRRPTWHLPHSYLFTEWRELMDDARRWLHQHGLRAIAFACDARRLLNEFVILRAEVSRI